MGQTEKHKGSLLPATAAVHRVPQHEEKVVGCKEADTHMVVKSLHYTDT